ncbi:cytochrome c3 family protein [Planctomycetales bacterium ZRK34]|nr:cytochrome c3 family protein [Planctomycetales bacterium ZRK34]
MVGLIGAPSTTDVGYQPVQPIPYSHELHVNQLGMDCRYCHTTVETSAFAAIPSANICMNCHHAIRKLNSAGEANPKLAALYKAYDSGMPIEWVKVHDLPDYSYFNHSAHINRGVSCVSCHDRVDQMGPEGVHQAKELSMGWCLKCHRNPTPNLRPQDQATNLMWGYTMTQQEIDEVASLGVDVAGMEAGKALTDQQRQKVGHAVFDMENIREPINMSDCSLCHR